MNTPLPNMSTLSPAKPDGVSVQLTPSALNWSETLAHLLGLARDANRAFNYEQALSYLDTLDGLRAGKELGAAGDQLALDLFREKGHALASLGKHEAAIEVYKRVLEHCAEPQQLSVRAETFTQIGQLLAKQGDYDRALGYLQRAIGAQRRLDDEVGMCKALRNLGVIYLQLGELDEAESNYNEAIEIAKLSGQEILYADLVNNLGVIKNMKGDWRTALDYYRESLNIYKAYDEVRKTAYTQNNLAITMTEQGLIDDAHNYFVKAYDIASDIQDSSLLLIININLADVYLRKGHPGDARKHCRLAVAYLKSTNAVNTQLIETKKLLGRIEAAEQLFDSALNQFNEALEIARTLGARFLEAEILLERGSLFRQMNRPFDALTDLEQSYRMYLGLKVQGKQEQTERTIYSIEQLYLESFERLGYDVDRKDPYTKGHSDRVAALSLLLGRELGLKSMVLKTIVAAALLHDLGKINIPDSILKKDGRLTEDEYTLIQRHPEEGVALLRGKEFPWDLKPLVLHHHERFDGAGYPLGLKGEDIPFGARIIALADVFDALTSDRVYRKAFSTEKALEMMGEDAGKSFDPVLFTCFKRMIDERKADFVINSRTAKDELYSIWKLCLPSDEQKDPLTTLVM